MSDLVPRSVLEDNSYSNTNKILSSTKRPDHPVQIHNLKLESNHEIHSNRTKNPDCAIEDSLTAVNFASPLRDVEPSSLSSRPVPAPRLSKMPSLTTMTADLGACDEQVRDCYYLMLHVPLIH